MSLTGLIALSSSFLLHEASTMVQSLGSPFSYPTRNFAASSSGCSVAPSPTLTRLWPIRFSRRATESERWTPLLLLASSCISSTMRYSRPFMFSMNLSEFISIARLSGVVTSMLGGLSSCCLLSFWLVSPVLTPIVTCLMFLFITSVAQLLLYEAVYLVERPRQVPVDVVVERPERRDVEAVYLLLQLALHAVVRTACLLSR